MSKLNYQEDSNSSYILSSIHSAIFKDSSDNYNKIGSDYQISQNIIKLKNRFKILKDIN